MTGKRGHVELLRCDKPSGVENLAGKSFNSWHVVRYAGRKLYNGTRSCAQYWLCECSCGAKRTIQHYSLKHGKSVCCGACAYQGKRGMCKHPLYSTWLGMRGRCHNPNHSDYIHYGARGIKVCKRWRESFAAFLSDMGERPKGLTLDRRDNNLGYSKSNCRWATSKEQGWNKRPYRRHRMRNSPMRRARRYQHIVRILKVLEAFN